MVDPKKGLTFSKTPTFNHTLLSRSLLDPLDAKGSSQTTTYTPATIGNYPFDKYYVKVRLGLWSPTVIPQQASACCVSARLVAPGCMLQ